MVKNYNKLRTQNKLKGSFHREPYITNVRNRNQRCELTRLRYSATLLGIERMRYTVSIVHLFIQVKASQISRYMTNCTTHAKPQPKPNLGMHAKVGYALLCTLYSLLACKPFTP